MVVAAGLAGVGSAGWTFWRQYHATHGEGSLSAIMRSPQQLDERPVATSRCQAGPRQPQKISLGSLQVTGCVVEVGITDRQLDAPGNIHVAGWLRTSAVPGDKDGLAIVDGHSSGRYKDGIFNRIGDFEPGELLTITLGNGSVKRFEVSSVRLHTVATAMDRLAVDARKERSNLALITCGGDYDATDHSFDRRVVVLARAV